MDGRRFGPGRADGRTVSLGNAPRQTTSLLTALKKAGPTGTFERPKTPSAKRCLATSVTVSVWATPEMTTRSFT